MKVTKLHIDEYKVFKDFDIDFTDGEGKAQNLIVLAGINGTGKTTLLEVMSNNNGFKHYLYNNEEINYIEFTNVSIGKNPSINIASEKQHLRQIYVETNLPESMMIQQGDLRLNNVIGYFKVGYFDQTNLESIVKKYIDEYIYDPHPILSTEVYAKLRDFIDSIFPDFLLGFKFKRYSSDGLLYFETLQGTEISFNDLSSGEKQLINFALSIFIDGIKYYVILIDEPEFSLHPSWQNKIVGVLQKYADEYNCQVILATHSPHIIGSVKPEQLRLLYKDDSGAIKVKDYVGGSYGWPVDRVLVGLMDMDGLRTPEAVRDLKELNELVRGNHYDTDEFKTKMQKLEDSIGADDEYLTAIRFEIVKRRKEGATNS